MQPGSPSNRVSIECLFGLGHPHVDKGISVAKKKTTRHAKAAAAPQRPPSPASVGPEANFRPLTILAQDPGILVNGNVLTTEILIPAEQLSEGPWGFRVQVVDYDATTKRYFKPLHGSNYFSPVQGYLDPYRDIAAASPNDLLADPRFHAQNAYAIVMRILARFELALGRRVKWSFPTHQIKVVPHAFADANAFYSEADEGLFFGYFPGRGGKPIFTCLSHDIVAHETTHALVDGLRTRFTDPSSPDQAAFHEGFSDVVALLSVFALPAVVDAVFEMRSGDTRALGDRRLIKAEALTIPALRKSVLLGLAEEMGEELSTVRGQPLRNSSQMLPSKNYLSDPEFEEPHRRGEILVAAVMHAFLNVLHARLQGLDGGRSGWLDRDRVVEECAKSADHLLTMCIRALDYCAPVHITFPDFLSALLTADYETCPDDSHFGYRDKLRESFDLYGIRPASIDVAEEGGMWRRCGSRLSYDHNHYRPMQTDPEEMFRFLWENREVLDVTDEVFTHVISVRPCLRMAPDGVPVQETIAEYLQVADLRADELQRLHIDPPDDMPPDTKVTLHGGGTLIFDEFGVLKFKVTNRIDHPVHQAERIKYLWEHGAFRGKSTASHFAELHRLRSVDRRMQAQERWF